MWRIQEIECSRQKYHCSQEGDINLGRNGTISSRLRTSVELIEIVTLLGASSESVSSCFVRIRTVLGTPPLSVIPPAFPGGDHDPSGGNAVSRRKISRYVADRSTPAMTQSLLSTSVCIQPFSSSRPCKRAKQYAPRIEATSQHQGSSALHVKLASALAAGVLTFAGTSLPFLPIASCCKRFGHDLDMGNYHCFLLLPGHEQ